MPRPAVLLLTPGFAADEQDLACIPPLQLLVQALDRRGVDFHIIALEYPFTGNVYAWHRQAVYPCNGQNRRWLRWRTLARARSYAQGIIAKGNVRAIHSCWLGQAWQLGESLAHQYMLPHFTTLMGQDVLLERNARYLKRLTPEQAHRTIALTVFQQQQLEKNTGLQAGHTIPWGIDPAEFVVAPPPFNARPPLVVGIGSLIPVKNWPLWIETARLIRQMYPEAMLEIIGGGPLQPSLEKAAHGSGIVFHGHLPRPQVLARLREARVLLHTAQTESFGYVLAEATASGCAVVSTPVGLAADSINTATDAASLARLVVQALNAAAIPRMEILTMDEVAGRYRDLLIV